MAANPYTTNLELQLDARDITGLIDGDPVATWSDSSAAGNDVSQSIPVFKPTYKTNIIGSAPAVRFASIYNSLYGSWAGSWASATGFTLFCLCQYSSYPTWEFPYIYSMGTSSGKLTAIFGGESAAVKTGRLSEIAYGESSYDTTPLFCLTEGVPSLFGVAMKNGSTGIKSITPLGISPERNTMHMNYTCEDFVIGNGYNSGSVRTDRGFTGDIVLLLVYKEYMSDSNIGDVVDWMLDEFDLHTQAAGGSGSILRVPGMGGGFNT